VTFASAPRSLDGTGQTVGSGLNLRPLLISFELSIDAGDAFLEECNRFHPGFEYLGRVARVEVARMGFLCGVSALRLFEFSFEVGQSLFEVFFAHALRLHGEVECG
jgi:hypothetical protein